MKLEQPEALEKVFPVFHGQSAKILAYAAAKGTTTPDEIRRGLKMPRSTVYSLVNELLLAGLATKEKVGRVERLKVPDFTIEIRNTGFGGCRLTSRNILAFDSAHTPAGRMFIGRHGLQKFARFVELYDQYRRDAATAQVMARELGVIRYEVELLLSDVRSLTPKAVELAYASHSR